MKYNMNELVREYKKLIAKGPYKVITAPTLDQYVPVPSETERTRTWMMRYFARKTNDESAPIMEINESQYNAISNVKYYKRKSLRWKIRGTMDDVADVNWKSLKLAEFDFPGILSRLPDLLQYWKKETS